MTSHAATIPPTANREICLVKNAKEKQRAAAATARSDLLTDSDVIPTRMKPNAGVSPKKVPKYQLLELASISKRTMPNKKPKVCFQPQRRDRRKAATSN